MEFADENVNATPDWMHFKNKQAIFSTSKKALFDVKNTIHLKNIDRNHEFEEFGSTFLKPQLITEEPSSNFKTPKQAKIVPMKSNTFDWNKMNDNFFTSCRCLEDLTVDNFFIFPEEINLTKNDINIFTTKWSNNSDSFEDIFSFSPVKTGDLRDIFDSTLNYSLNENQSYLDISDGSYEINIPRIEEVVI